MKKNIQEVPTLQEYNLEGIGLFIGQIIETVLWIQQNDQRVRRMINTVEDMKKKIQVTSGPNNISKMLGPSIKKEGIYEIIALSESPLFNTEDKSLIKLKARLNEFVKYLRRRYGVLIDFIVLARKKGINSQQIFDYVKSNDANLIYAISNIHDKDIKINLIKIYYLINDEERNYLLKCHNEILSWPAILPRLGILGTIKTVSYKINLFIRGGGSYKGILTDFKDNQLYDQVIKNENLKALIRYGAQRQYFAELLMLVRKGVKEGTWKDFYSFWNHINSHIRIIEKRFVNVDLANRIRKYKEKFGESPSSWIKALSQISQTLDSEFYFDKNTLEPTINDLAAIFSSKENEINSKKEEHIIEFIGLLDNYFNSLAAFIWKRIRKETGPKGFLANIRNSIILKSFEREEVGLNVLVYDFYQIVSEINSKHSELVREINRVKEIRRYSKEWLSSLVNHLNSYLPDGAEVLPRNAHLFLNLFTGNANIREQKVGLEQDMVNNIIRYPVSEKAERVKSLVVEIEKKFAELSEIYRRFELIQNT